MGSDESHFNFSFIVRDNVTRQCPQATTFEEKGEPKRNRSDVLLLTARPNRLTRVAVVFDRFYIALFSALEQTHCARL